MSFATFVASIKICHESHIATRWRRIKFLDVIFRSQQLLPIILTKLHEASEKPEDLSLSITQQAYLCMLCIHNSPWWFFISYFCTFCIIMSTEIISDAIGRLTRYIISLAYIKSLPRDRKKISFKSNKLFYLSLSLSFFSTESINPCVAYRSKRTIGSAHLWKGTVRF